MTTTTIACEDLEKFVLDFGLNRESFYQEFFRDVTNREATEACGFTIKSGPGTYASNLIRGTGRLRASRFKLACTKLRRDSNYFVSKYQPQVFQCGSGRKAYPVGEKLRDVIYRALCDSK